MKFGPIKLPVVTPYDLDREKERLERLRKNYSTEGDSAQARKIKLQLAIVELARVGLAAQAGVE